MSDQMSGIPARRTAYTPTPVDVAFWLAWFPLCAFVALLALWWEVAAAFALLTGAGPTADIRFWLFVAVAIMLCGALAFAGGWLCERLVLRFGRGTPVWWAPFAVALPLWIIVGASAPAILRALRSWAGGTPVVSVAIIVPLLFVPTLVGQYVGVIRTRRRQSSQCMATD